MRSTYVGALVVASALWRPACAQDAYSNATPAERRGMEAVTLWKGCLEGAASEMLSSKEEAGTVADAVIGSCSGEEAAVHTAWFPAYASVDPRNADADTREAVNSMRRTLRGKLLARIVKARLNN